MKVIQPKLQDISEDLAWLESYGPDAMSSFEYYVSRALFIIAKILYFIALQQRGIR